VNYDYECVGDQLTQLRTAAGSLPGMTFFGRHEALLPDGIRTTFVFGDYPLDVSQALAIAPVDEPLLGWQLPDDTGRDHVEDRAPEEVRTMWTVLESQLLKVKAEPDGVIFKTCISSPTGGLMVVVFEDGQAIAFGGKFMVMKARIREDA
jgi:hypothetical protein